MSESQKAVRLFELDQLEGFVLDRDLDYVIFRYSDMEKLDLLPLHVLARAYRAAWQVFYNCEPRGRHPITALDLLIYFRDGSGKSRQ